MKFILFLTTSLVALGLMAESTTLGDSQIRATAGKSSIVITATRRLAGAIHSLTWDGTEFINSADHGRQLQSACSFDNSAAFGAETYNPTEAGSRDDGSGPNTTSQLLEIIAQGNHLKTRTRMAFWLRPGERSAGQLARNTHSISDYILTKDVSLGYQKWPQALDYRVTFTLPPQTHHTSAQYETLTGYMPAEFEKFMQFNPSTGNLESLSDGPGEIKNPVVLSTVDGRHAMGIFADSKNQGGGAKPSFGRWRFKDAQVVKWNCVFRVQNPQGIQSADYTFHMLVPIGTLVEVEQMLREWEAQN